MLDPDILHTGRYMSCIVCISVRVVEAAPREDPQTYIYKRHAAIPGRRQRTSIVLHRIVASYGGRESCT